MRRTGRRRLVVWGVSAAAHGLVILALLAAPAPPPPREEPEPVAVALVTPPPRPPPPEPTPEPKPAPQKAAPPKPEQRAPPVKRIPVRKPVAVQAPVAPLVVASGPPSEGEVSDAELSGAAVAGSGSGAGGCDMARRLQTALRKDQRVRAALTEAGATRPLRVWNGDWVRHAGQEGNGLAAVREAIIWEVGFAPEPCRREPVQGLVLLSMADAPGSARIVVGAGAWRWSDLLKLKP